MTLGTRCEICDGENGFHEGHCVIGQEQRLISGMAALGGGHEAPADGTRDGGGVWRGGKWYPDVGQSGGNVLLKPQEMDAYLARLANEKALEEEEVEKAQRTHHEAGSPEEAHSRRVRMDKYVAMQALLMEIANCPPADNHAAQFGPRAQAILAGMQPKFREPRRRFPAGLANERATELETLAFAYRVIGLLHPSQPPLQRNAAELTLKALQAWERDHPPVPLDLPL